MAKTSIAWQRWTDDGLPGSWSKSHETADNGLTTLCGLTVPEDVCDYDGDSRFHSSCKRCAKASQPATQETVTMIEGACEAHEARIEWKWTA